MNRVVAAALEPARSSTEALARGTCEGYERYGKLECSVGIKPQ